MHLGTTNSCDWSVWVIVFCLLSFQMLWNLQHDYSTKQFTIQLTPRFRVKQERSSRGYEKMPIRSLFRFTHKKWPQERKEHPFCLLLLNTAVLKLN